MNSAIVLRDIPKDSVKLDHFTFSNLEGGFRGFCQVPPGLHYISILSSNSHVGFWCFLKPNDALVKVFNYEENCFEDSDLDSEQKYKQLALSGSMGSSLKIYPTQYFPQWKALSCFIQEEHFPPKIHDLDPPSNSRFESAWKNTHKGSLESFMQEFQYSFLQWYCSIQTNDQEVGAFERWTFLLQSIYNAGEGNIKENPKLFMDIVDTLIAQFPCLNEEYFTKGSSIIEGIRYLIEDMQDSGNPQAKEKANELAVYMKNRNINS